MEDIADFFFNSRKDEFCAATFLNIIFHYSLQIFYSLEPDSICSSKKWALNTWPLQILSLSGLSHNLYEKKKNQRHDQI